MCVNNEGSYTCQCKPGFIQVGDNSCRDIDECGRSSTTCGNGKCLNLPGSYECECDFGYLLTNDRKGCEGMVKISQLVRSCVRTSCPELSTSFQQFVNNNL